MKKAFWFLWACAGAAAAFTVSDWLAVNGSNEAVFLRQRENGERWTWDILAAEVWAWRFSVGAEAEFNHPRRLNFETIGVPDPEGDEVTQRYGRYRDNTFDARVGTFDQTFGKGMTLRSYADRDFGVDQRLDGANVDAVGVFGGREWGSVSAVWGRNIRDDINQTEKDWVGGGQITLRPVDFAYVTGSAVRAGVEDFNADPFEPLEDEKLYGAGVGGGWKYFDLYGEYATRRGYDFAAYEEQDGHGLYGVLTGYLPHASVAVEYKNYQHLSYPYNNPPPVSYDTRMITGGVGAPPNEWGYFAQVTANPFDDLRVSGGYSYADDNVGDSPEKTAEIYQGFGTARYDFAFPVVLEAGYAHLGAINFTPVGLTGELRRTPSVKGSWNVTDVHGVMAEVEREDRTEYLVDRTYVDNRASVGYNYASWLGVTVDYEDSSERVRETVDRGDPGQGILPTYRYKHNWLWGELRLSWYSPVFQNHVLAIGYGSQRGGLVCSSGVCRQQVPFSGLKAELSTTF